MESWPCLCRWGRGTGRSCWRTGLPAAGSAWVLQVNMKTVIEAAIPTAWIVSWWFLFQVSGTDRWVDRKTGHSARLSLNRYSAEAVYGALVNHHVQRASGLQLHAAETGGTGRGRHFGDVSIIGPSGFRSITLMRDPLAFRRSQYPGSSPPRGRPSHPTARPARRRHC